MDLDSIAKEFNCLIVDSTHCFYCLEKKEKKTLTILDLHEENKWLLEPYEMLGCPYCLTCHDLGVPGLDKQKVVDNAIYAMFIFPFNVLNKEFKETAENES